MSEGGKVLKAAASFGKTVRGAHFTSGHSHQVLLVAGGNKSTTVTGISTNSVLLQFQQCGKLSAGLTVLGTQTDFTASCTLTTDKVTHTSNFSNKVMLVSWDQLDA